MRSDSAQYRVKKTRHCHVVTPDFSIDSLNQIRIEFVEVMWVRLYGAKTRVFLSLKIWKAKLHVSVVQGSLVHHLSQCSRNRDWEENLRELYRNGTGTVAAHVADHQARGESLIDQEKELTIRCNC